MKKLSYFALASACPCERERSAVCQVRLGEREGAREGAWDRVADRNPGSWRQVGGAVGVAAEDVSDEPL